MRVLTKPLKPSNDYLRQQGHFPVIFVDGLSPYISNWVSYLSQSSNT